MTVLGRAFIEVKADLAGFAPELRAKLEAALREGTAGVSFEPLGDKAEKAGGEAADRAGKGFKERSKTSMRKAGEDAGGSLAAGMAKGILSKGGLIGGAVVAAINAAVQAAPAAAGLAAALPLALSSLIAVVGTLKLAFGGLGDAIKGALGPGGPSAEAMKNLAPAARDFVREIQKIHPEMKALREEVQQAFFHQLEGSLSRVVHNLLPSLRGGLSGLAGVLGGIGGSIAGALSGPGAKGDIAAILKNATDAARPFIPVLGALVTAFLTLSRVAGPFLTVLSQGLAGAGQRFADFIASIKPGQFADFFNLALESLRALGSLLKDIGSIGLSVFAALFHNGEPLLGVLGSVVHALADFLNTAAGHQALETLGTLLGTIGNALGKVLVPLLPVAATLVTILAGPLTDIISQIAGPLGDVAVALANALIPVLQALAPALEKIGGQLGLALVKILIAMADILSRPDFVKSLVILATGLSEILIAIAPLLPALGAFLGFLVQLPSPLEIFAANTHKIGDFFRTLKGFVEGIPALLAQIPGLLAQIPGLILAGLKTGLDFLLRGVGEAIGLVLALFIKMPGLVLDELRALPVQMAVLFEQVKALVVGIFSSMWDSAKASTSSAVSTVVSLITNLPGRLLGLGKALFNAALSLAHQIGDGFSHIGSFASDIGGKIVSAIKSGLNSVIDSINRGIGDIDKIIPGPGLPRLPHFAKGGIVDSPTLAVLGERGKTEVVIPLDDAARARQLATQSGLLAVLGQAGGQHTVNVTAILGTGQILEVLDSRVDQGLARAADNELHGLRPAA